MFVYEKHGQARKRHIRNSNKNLLHDPGYRLENAVQLSLQSGRNTQLKTCTIPGLTLEGDSGEEIAL